MSPDRNWDRHKRVEKTCLHCGKLFMARVGRTDPKRGRYCSLSCAAKVGGKSAPHPLGPDSPSFKGGMKQWQINYREKNRLYRRNNPIKRRNHAIVERAIKDGTLVRTPCEVCGKVKVHGHHDDDSKAREVRWLCPKHHNEHHRRLRELNHEEENRTSLLLAYA